jgi:tetratricopeptide (TPR) repeat protein
VLLQDKGDYAGAERLHRAALAIRKETLGSQHADVAESLRLLAETLAAQKRWAEADPLAAEAVAITRKTVPDSRNLGAALRVQGSVLVGEERLDEAAPLLEEALELLRRIEPADSTFTATAKAGYAELLVRKGRVAEAEALLVEAVAVMDKQMPLLAETREARARLAALRRMNGAPRAATR